jgi:hypothetical protein
MGVGEPEYFVGREYFLRSAGLSPSLWSIHVPTESSLPNRISGFGASPHAKADPLW